MDCPGCGERIHREELIDGECPLCGKIVRGESDEKEMLEEINEMFGGDPEALAVGVSSEAAGSRRMVLHVSPSLADRVKPKRCAACGRWHLKFGDKEYKVDLEGTEGTLEIEYICGLCNAE